jgi:hypothetical protein
VQDVTFFSLISCGDAVCARTGCAQQQQQQQQQQQWRTCVMKRGVTASSSKLPFVLM